MKSVGIDLAGVESRPTGMCVMDSNFRVSTCLLYTNNEIVSKTIEYKPDVVAIDAPWALPHGRESLAKKNKIHLRECDRELVRMGIKFFPLTLGPMRQLTERGMLLRMEMKNSALTVIETYPGAAQDILRIPRKGKGLDKLADGLRQAGIKGLNSAMNWGRMDLMDTKVR